MELMDKYVVIEHMDNDYPQELKPDISDLLQKEWSISYDGIHTKQEILETLSTYIKEWLAGVNEDVLDSLNKRLIDLDEMVQYFRENLDFYDTLRFKCFRHGYVGDADA